MNILKTFRNTLFPPVCPLCRSLVPDDLSLCATCWPKIDFIQDPACNRCGCPLSVGDYLEQSICIPCTTTPPAFSKNMSVFVYSKESKSMILFLKHGEKFHLGPLLAKMMYRRGQHLFQQTDVLLPVPLHWTRLLKRGFNQSGELAKHLCVLTGIPCDVRSLKRIRATPSQEGLNKKHRQDNLKDAFCVTDPSRIYKKNILLIDDVITTGSTLNSAATVLLKNGAQSVNTLTLGWVSPSHKQTIF